MIDLKEIEKLSCLCGISGYEEEVGYYVKQQLELISDRVIQDGLGSVIGYKNMNRDGIKIMIAGHMDEIGFIVRDIDQQGYLKLTPIGSWWSHMVLGQTFTVVTQNKKYIQGIIGSKATHGLPQEIKEKTVALEDIYLDLGISSKEDCINLGIQIGDMVAPYCEFRTMNHPKYICGKALDDRIGVYIGLEVLRRINSNCPNTIALAATVQEEPGLRGARTATDMVHPELAFAIDTTLSGDTPMNQNCTHLGEGVVLSMIDSNTLVHRGLIQYVEKICVEKEIKHQYAVFNKGGTDSGNIHKSFEGIVNMTLSIPIRYMHTNQSMIHEDDVEACIHLLVELCTTMNKNSFREIENY